MAVQWLGLGAFTARVQVQFPGWGTKISQAVKLPKKKKKKRNREREDYRYFSIFK